MGMDLIDLVNETNKLNLAPSKTDSLKIYGYTNNISWDDNLHFYGSKKMDVVNSGSPKALTNKLPITAAQIIYAVKYEMAKTIEDVLSRRTRCLFIDAKECIKIAPLVAKIMSSELNTPENWEREQIKLFLELAKNYHL